MTTAADPRANTNMRLRASALARVDSIAAAQDWNRAQALRTLLLLGLRAWDRGERP